MSRVPWCWTPSSKKVGLSGKSVIPFVIATGCGIPGNYGLPYHPQRAGAPVYRYAGYVYALRG